MVEQREGRQPGLMQSGANIGSERFGAVVADAMGRPSKTRAERRAERVARGERAIVRMPGLVEPWPRRHANQAEPSPRIMFSSK